MVCPGEGEENENFQLGVYPRRWIILFISCTAICLRGFNQSCYGPINSVFVKYLQIQPWQVDWFSLTQSVIFLSMAIPLSWITSRIGFKNSYVMMTITLTIGYTLTTIGVSTPSGFPAIITGQCIMGFSNIISWSIPPPTAAIWFPTREVATAVALQVVGRGIGESLGSILTPILVNPQQKLNIIGSRLTLIFASVTLISMILVGLVFAFVVDQPPLPPSKSRAKAIKEKPESNRSQEFNYALKKYKNDLVELFLDPHFVCIWFVFGVANPVLRNNSVLLSSVLQTAFAEEISLNIKTGIVLMCGWIAYTAGGFIAGPLITKTKKYKAIVLFSVGFECVSSFIVMVGVETRLSICIYAGVVGTGLFLGMANTSLFEIILEITYPKPPMLVTMINIIGMGFCRLLYPIVGRIMLSYIGATAPTAFPFVLLLLSSIILIIINPHYKRLLADTHSMSETENLMS